MDEFDDDSVLYNTTFLAAHIPNRPLKNGLSRNEIMYESVEPLLQELCKRAHSAASGHHGAARTHENIKVILANEFPSKFIPNKHIVQAVRKYIQHCPICQKNDEHTLPSHGERFVTSSLLPFFTVQIDHQGPFPMNKLGKQYVCGIICTFSDYFDATPVPSVDALSTDGTGVASK